MRIFATAIGVLALSGTAFGGVALPAGFDVQVGWGTNTWNLSDHPEAVDDVVHMGDGMLRVMIGNYSEGNWSLTNTFFDVPDVSAPADRSNSVFINSSFSLTNVTGSTQSFSVGVFQGGVKNIAGPTSITGSNSGNVGDNISPNLGATLSTTTGLPFYESFIDGTPVQMLFSDPFSVSAPPALTNSYGPGNYINVPSIALTSSVSIVNRFDLTAGDNAGMTSTFLVVPTTGVTSMMMVAGLAAVRRRR